MWSEGRYQVGEMVSEWIGNLPSATRRNLTTWLYDDMYVNLKRKRKSCRFHHFVFYVRCHLGPLIDGERILDSSSETSKVMVGLKKAVDSFHFKGHTDKKCQENYYPEKLKKELGVDCLNTPVS